MVPNCNFFHLIAHCVQADSPISLGEAATQVSILLQHSQTNIFTLENILVFGIFGNFLIFFFSNATYGVVRRWPSLIIWWLSSILCWPVFTILNHLAVFGRISPNRWIIIVVMIFTLLNHWLNITTKIMFICLFLLCLQSFSNGAQILNLNFSQCDNVCVDHQLYCSPSWRPMKNIDRALSVEYVICVRNYKFKTYSQIT